MSKRNKKDFVRNGQTIGSRNQCRTNRGNELIATEYATRSEGYDLSWFHPTHNQRNIIDSINENDCTFVQASSGCGKSTTAIFQSLKLLKTGDYRKIVFIKSASEDSNDKIGFLTGDANQKLAVHMEAMRGIFYSFMSKAKLELEEKRGTIEFTIPNFIAGLTWNEGTIIIVDEAQKISDNILKLIMERVSDGCKLIILGDRLQRYSHDKRNDGFTTFINMITDVDDDNVRYSVEQPIFGYVQLTSEDNMRGRLSKRTLELFENYFDSKNIKVRH